MDLAPRQHPFAVFFSCLFLASIGNCCGINQKLCSCTYSIFNIQRPIKSVHIISFSQIFILFHSKGSATCRSIRLINSSIFHYSLIMMMMMITSNSFDKQFSMESNRCDKVFQQKTKTNPLLNLNDKKKQNKNKNTPHHTKRNGSHGMTTTVYTWRVHCSVLKQ